MSRDNPYGLTWAAPGDPTEAISRTGADHHEGLMRRINALEFPVMGIQNKFEGWDGDDPNYCLPRGISIMDCEIYLVDSNSNRVRVFGLDGSFSRQWGTPGSGDGQFSSPFDICAYGGEVYVADAQNHRIQVFGTDGTFLRKWGTYGTGNNEINLAMALAIDSGLVYVMEGYGTRVHVFDTSGVYQTKWGSSGSGNGQFGTLSQGILVYDSEVYVVDSGNSRVQVFNLTGTWQRKWDLDSSGVHKIGQLGGEIYVCDGNDDKVQVFKTDGTFVRQWLGSDAGMNTPWGIAFYVNYVYICGAYGYVVLYIPGAQTEFHAYTKTTPESLGTPDSGATVPADGALSSAFGGPPGSVMSSQIILDMRAAIEAIVATGYYANPATSNPYNWTNASADNLYHCAVDRTKFGAAAGGYTWLMTPSSGPIYDADMEEIRACVATLEES